MRKWPVLAWIEVGGWISCAVAAFGAIASANWLALVFIGTTAGWILNERCARLWS